MTNQPKPAPTAEEQPLELPPLDVTQEERTQIETMRPMAPRNTLLALERLACRERQLLAALRSNREKDARIAELEYRIGELESRYQASVKDRRDFRSAMKLARKHQAAAEAKLRAVSDALEEKLEPEVVFDPDFDGYIHRYDQDEVDVLLARIRAIVEGK